MAIRNAEGMDVIPITAVLLLLDRAHDVFQVQRCDADGYLIKPLDSLRLRKASDALLAGEAYADLIDVVSGEAADLATQA
jgi:DNA-binding NarL/FixJ family response regulator